MARPSDTATTADTRATADDASVTELGATPAAEPDPLIGALVAGRYRIERRLGEGGMGRVYQAMQVQLGRPIALKLLRPELSGRKDVVQRFEREARAASRLSHPGSITVFDFGSWQGRLFLAMEFVAGVSLDELIRTASPLPLAQVLGLAAQLCDALGAAHAQGLLHRDLKPENIMIAKDKDGCDHAKICDYGLAFLIDEEGKAAPRLTRAGSVAGTPSFMAPEQVMNRPLDGRTDLYALGCVLYEMLCGTPPFLGNGSMEILTKQLYDEPEPLSRRAQRPVPPELERIVMWTLQKSPANRPQSAAELKAALLEALVATARSGLPSSGEVLALVSREARVEAAGLLAPGPGPSAEGGPTTSDVLVVASADTPFEGSAIAVLRAQGITVRCASDFETAEGAAAVVVDVRDDAPAGVQRIALALARLPQLRSTTLLIVGPDDDFATMTRALELQSAEYIPASLLSTLPRKLRRALARARRNTR